MKTYFLVFSNPVEGKEEIYNKWYNEVHAVEMAAVEGVLSAQRFEFEQIGSKSVTGRPFNHKYLGLYEFDPNMPVGQVMKNIAEAGPGFAMVPEGCDAPVIDTSDIDTMVFRAITDVIK